MRKRPLLLDLFCGAGGAGMGYHRAGFDVVGVDIAPQKHYPFEFIHADVMTFPLDGFDAIHASPPCQHYAAVTRWRGRVESHPDLVGPVRTRLTAAGVPWVMENIYGSPLNASVVLCGTAFGLRVKRHRYFEASNDIFALVPPCLHRDLHSFEHKGERSFADAMECTWMTAHEGRQAIPPAYTEWIGRQLLMAIRQQEASA